MTTELTAGLTEGDDAAWVVAVAVVRERPSQPSASAPPSEPSR